MLGQPHSTLPRVVLDLQTPGERTLTLSYAGFTEFHIAYLKLHLECLVVRFLYFLSMVSFLGMRLKRKLFEDLSMCFYNEYQIITYFCEKFRFNFDAKFEFHHVISYALLACGHSYLFSCYRSSVILYETNFSVQQEYLLLGQYVQGQRIWIGFNSDFKMVHNIFRLFLRYFHR